MSRVASLLVASVLALVALVAQPVGAPTNACEAGTPTCAQVVLGGLCYGGHVSFSGGSREPQTWRIMWLNANVATGEVWDDGSRVLADRTAFLQGIDLPVRLADAQAIIANVSVLEGVPSGESTWAPLVQSALACSA